MPAAPLLTTREVAAHLGVNVRTIARIVERGELPVADQIEHYPTAPMRFRRPDVERLAARRAKAAAKRVAS